jgi:hypothetical protein
MHDLRWFVGIYVLVCRVCVSKENQIPASTLTSNISDLLYYLTEVRDKFLQLRSRNEAKQFGPRFQGKSTEFRKIRFNLLVINFKVIFMWIRKICLNCIFEENCFLICRQCERTKNLHFHWLSFYQIICSKGFTIIIV